MGDISAQTNSGTQKFISTHNRLDKSRSIGLYRKKANSYSISHTE